MFPEYRLGIEPIKDNDAPTFDQMREAIYNGQRDSALIKGTLDSANYLGLSGEDKYVLLAYQALIHLEDSHKRLMRVVSLTPGPITFELPGNKPQQSRRGE